MTSGADRMRRQKQARYRDGWVEVSSLWVPTREQADHIRALAQSYRDEARARVGLEPVKPRRRVRPLP